MITGLGFTEILTILVIVLLFFGSKEVPKFLGEVARLIGKVRQYGDSVRRELDDITRTSNPVDIDNTAKKKNKLRKEFLVYRKELDEDEKEKKSADTVKNLLNYPKIKTAEAIMVYVNTDSELKTRNLIKKLLEQKKRILIPYTRPDEKNLGIAEIKNLEKDTEIGKYGILEPLPEIRDNFFKSDIQFVICPGVAFDRTGRRIGQGKGLYDNFLKELSGKIPIVGIAFNCQIYEKTLPFDYHDVTVDEVITENGKTVFADS